MADWTSGLNPEFTRRLNAFFAAAPPGLFGPGSGYRSYEEQARLYNAYKAGVPGQARAARPGKSQHNHGLAMDLDFNEGRRREAVAWAHANAARFGLFFPMSDEDWHIQPVGLTDSAGASGPMDKQFMKGLMSAGIDPQDELASRMNQIMQIMVGQPADPSKGFTGDKGELLPYDPSQLQYMSQLFGGSDDEFSGTPMVAPSAGQGSYQKYAMKKMAEKYGWGPEEFSALDILWGQKESGWDPTADNPTSTAAGIAQKLQSVHGPVESTGEAQIDWGLDYIFGRYGSPSAALAHHRRMNWY